MSDVSNSGQGYGQYGQPAYGQQGYSDPIPAQQYGSQGYAPAGYPVGPQAYGSPQGGPIGGVRGTGVCILLFIVTLGFYGWFYFYKIHEEMKRHSGQGIGGGIALILTIFVSFVLPYLSSAEVGKLYERRGQHAPVSAMTGLWYFPGMFIIVGPIVWFVKMNGALNAYWRSLGAAG